MELEIASFGLLSQNFIVAPLYDSLGLEIIKELLTKMKPSVLIIHPSKLTQFCSLLISLTPTLHSIVLLDNWISSPSILSSINIYTYVEVISNFNYCLSPIISKPSDASYILYTSGSTGFPKVQI